MLPTYNYHVHPASCYRLLRTSGSTERSMTPERLDMAEKRRNLALGTERTHRAGIRPDLHTYVRNVPSTLAHVTQDPNGTRMHENFPTDDEIMRGLGRIHRNMATILTMPIQSPQESAHDSSMAS